MFAGWGIKFASANFTVTRLDLTILYTPHEVTKRAKDNRAAVTMISLCPPAPSNILGAGK